jgi:hypothetical protein
MTHPFCDILRGCSSSQGFGNVGGSLYFPCLSCRSLPRAMGWVAEQWAGNRVGNAVDSVLAAIHWSWVSVVWLWTQAHPLQSVFYFTCSLVALFSIETLAVTVLPKESGRWCRPLLAASPGCCPPKLGHVKNLLWLPIPPHYVASAHTIAEAYFGDACLPHRTTGGFR